MKNNDGDPGACAQVRPGASSLPDGCSAILRLELAPINIAEKTIAKTEYDAVRAPTCPQGMVVSAGKCAQASGTRPYVCKYGSGSECVTECEKGSAVSCGQLGLMYFNGEGVPKDITRAAGLFQKACDGGDLEGCSDLGVRHFNGEGVAKDVAQGTALLRRACDAGSTRGCYNLGVMYSDGKDAARAAVLYRMACVNDRHDP